VEQLHQQGEWVEAGQPVLRVIRLDRLLVEGYVEAKLVDQSSRGRRVQVQAQTRAGAIVVEGRLTFVSPEIDSVNQQVLVKAEIENRDLQLRPGQPVEMVIAAP
jgi:multidrug efflux pump subunit AcrA (membrane-fusion protein)